MIKDLDRQPWPDRERIAMDKYLATWRKHHGMGSVSLITARGCPYSCTWCSHSTFGRTHRRRSVTGVVDEIAWIRERYAPEMLWIADDVFTIDHGWLARFALEMKAPRIEDPVRVHHARGPGEPERGGDAGGTGLLPGVDRIGERLAEDPGRHEARRDGETGSGCGHLCRATGYPDGHVPDVGLRRRDARGYRRHGAARERLPAGCVSDDGLLSDQRDAVLSSEVAGRLVQLGEWARSSDRDIRIRGRHSRHFYEYADQWLKAEMAMDSGAGSNGLAMGLKETFQEVEA